LQPEGKIAKQQVLADHPAGLDHESRGFKAAMWEMAVTFWYLAGLRSTGFARSGGGSLECLQAASSMAEAALPVSLGRGINRGSQIRHE
jgi:hypothetical protein